MTRRSLQLCVLTLTLVACHEDHEAPPQAPQPVRVEVSAPTRGDVTDALTVTGETAALSVLRLASPVAGRVTVLSAHPGDTLAAGEAAARVISLENDAAVHGFAFLDGAAQLSQSERARARTLQRELAARDIPLRVPFTGVVAERLHNPGEQVAQNDVLLELFDPRSLYALAQVPVESAARVHVDMPAEVSTGSMTVTGQVAGMISALTPQTLTVPVRITLTTPLQPPLLHAPVQVRIIVAQHRGAILIPRSALLTSNVTDEGTVMVVADGTARRRTLQLGVRTATNVEVTQGLAAGELVLTNGQYALPDDTPIEPQPVASHQ